jgi:hypothetical protein
MKMEKDPGGVCYGKEEYFRPDLFVSVPQALSFLMDGCIIPLPLP